jgi:hypothetical protein
MLKTSVSTASVMASIGNPETIEKAKGYDKWTYDVYYNILMKAAIDDDRAKKRTSRSTKTKAQINKAERKANSATQGHGGRGGGRGGGRNGRGGRGGRGGRSGDGGQIHSSNFVPWETWKTLTQEAQDIIKNANNTKRTAAQHITINATQMSYGAIQLPDALWSQLPPGAQTAITTHNNTLSSGHRANTQASMHTQMHSATQIAQMNAPPQFSPLPPVTNPVQQANAHGQTQPAATNPPAQQQRTPTVQTPAQPFLHNMMSSSNALPEQTELIQINGHTYYRTGCTAKIHYKCSPHETQGKSHGALIDGGANGGFGGDDVLVIDWGDKKADVTGIDSHKLKDLPIVTCLGLIKTTRGPAIVVMHQYAYHGKGKTIHAPTQMAHFGHDVNEKSIKSPCGTGKQRIITPDGYVIPLDVVDGLAFMPMSKPTEEERDTLPHIFLTGDMDWDPSCMDHTFTDADGAFDDPSGALIDVDDLFEHFENRTTLTGEIIHPDAACDYHFGNSQERACSYLANNHKTRLKDPDYEALRPNFGWAPIGIIKKTFAKSTQFFRNMFRLPLRKHFKSRFPGANVGRRNEAVAMDTYFSDTPALGGSVKMAQIYVGRKTMVTDVYPMLSESMIPATLEHNIKDRGAMETIISD